MKIHLDLSFYYYKTWLFTKYIYSSNAIESATFLIPFCNVLPKNEFKRILHAINTAYI
jgi:hypothetical protein